VDFLIGRGIAAYFPANISSFSPVPVRISVMRKFYIAGALAIPITL
jgi:hypothetical protein